MICYPSNCDQSDLSDYNNMSDQSDSSDPSKLSDQGDLSDFIQYGVCYIAS